MICPVRAVPTMSNKGHLWPCQHHERWFHVFWSRKDCITKNSCSSSPQCLLQGSLFGFCPCFVCIILWISLVGMVFQCCTAGVLHSWQWRCEELNRQSFWQDDLQVIRARAFWCLWHLVDRCFQILDYHPPCYRLCKRSWSFAATIEQTERRP